jgi:L-seryl-tRNA(Ser) seleniumtransferase
MSTELLRSIPGIDRLLKTSDAAWLTAQYGHDLAVQALRDALDQVRDDIRAGAAKVPGHETIVRHAAALLDAWVTPAPRRVINASGVIIHTNLGRAPLSDASIEAMVSVAQGYSNLEYDLVQGARGSRSDHLTALLARLTGAEAAFVVNNNAAATILALAALAGADRDHPDGRGVVISRGQLVEIGGGYRMPDVMRHSGARMIEVGTTNRTHLFDYQNALDSDVALIMRVHHSNYTILGFTAEPELAELAELARSASVLLVDDIGSGALLDTTEYGLGAEPMVQHSIAAGADLVMFSGDKLLGGPQAGILVGRAEVIRRLRRHPLARAVRPDKLCLAALSATLAHYLKGEAPAKVPIWRMIAMSQEEITSQASRWRGVLEQAGLTCDLISGQSAIGGGSLPGQMLPTTLLAVRVRSPEEAAALLRQRSVPVVVRREGQHVLVDPRTVLPRDEQDLLAALCDLVPLTGAIP